MKTNENIVKIQECLKLTITPNNSKNTLIDEQSAMEYVNKTNAHEALLAGLRCDEPVLDFVIDCVEKNPEAVKLTREPSTKIIKDPDVFNLNAFVEVTEKHIDLTLMSDLVQDKIKKIQDRIALFQRKKEDNTYTINHIRTEVMADEQYFTTVIANRTQENTNFDQAIARSQDDNKKYTKMLDVIKKAEKELGIKVIKPESLKEEGYYYEYYPKSRKVVLAKQETKFRDSLEKTLLEQSDRQHKTELSYEKLMQEMLLLKEKLEKLENNKTKEDK